jgi:hypothetical protein
MPNGAGADVAGAVTQAMALGAGLAALAAARAGAQVAAGLRDGQVPVEVGYSSESSGLRIWFRADAAELDRLASALVEHKPSLEAEGLELWFERPSLHVVP